MKRSDGGVVSGVCGDLRPELGVRGVFGVRGVRGVGGGPDETMVNKTIVARRTRMKCKVEIENADHTFSPLNPNQHHPIKHFVFLYFLKHNSFRFRVENHYRWFYAIKHYRVPCVAY